MSCFNYDSSSDSDSDSSSASRSYHSDSSPRYYPTQAHHAPTPRRSDNASKKRRWSETDDESDLPGVPDYRSSSNFSYDSDSSLYSSENSRKTKRRRADNGESEAPVAGGARNFMLKGYPTPVSAPAPRMTTATRPRLYQPPAARSVRKLSEDLQYLTLNDLLFHKGGEVESRSVPALTRPAQTQPFIHTHPAPKPTTAPKKPKVVVQTWLGAGTTTWSFAGL